MEPIAWTVAFKLGVLKNERSPGKDGKRLERLERLRYRMLRVLAVVAFVGVAAASYASNLNYRSPSHNHPSLGISIHKVNKRNAGSPPQTAAGLNFTHGVASGDPYPTSVILWTRCAPTQDDVHDNSTVSGYVPLYNPVPIYGNDTAPASKAPICVSFKVASDSKLTKVVHSGIAYTSSDVDYTLKVAYVGAITRR